jgi:hypothetical protein
VVLKPEVEVDGVQEKGKSPYTNREKHKERGKDGDMN